MPGPPRLGRWSIARTGVLAGLGAGVAMGGWLMAVGEISAVQTAIPGIRSSTWTAVTGLTSVVFGRDALHGDFDALSILFGLTAHTVNAILFGLLGIALFVYTAGTRPAPVLAAGLGLGYGLALQVATLNLAVNGLQDDNRLYEAIPQWGWWVGTATYGIAYGLLAGHLLRRATDRVQDAP